MSSLVKRSMLLVAVLVLLFSAAIGLALMVGTPTEVDRAPVPTSVEGEPAITQQSDDDRVMIGPIAGVRTPTGRDSPVELVSLGTAGLIGSTAIVVRVWQRRRL